MTGGEIFLGIVIVVVIGILIENQQKIKMASLGMEQKVVSVDGDDEKIIWVKTNTDIEAPLEVKVD